jgi:hypothetical protein
MKVCSKCREPKPPEGFFRQSCSLDGLDPYCRTCRATLKREKYRRDHKWRENLLETRKETRRVNGEKIREWHRSYLKKKRENPLFRIVATMRTRLNEILRGRRKEETTKKLLGCSLEFFRAHLENKFQPGMTWENYGNGLDKWTVDHIRPCNSFDFSDPAQQKECFHYSNLQPLWFLDNVRKGAKVIVS